MSKLSTLEHEVLQLPEEQRIALLSNILKSSEPRHSAEVESAWEEEICKRIDLVDQNQTKRIPASVVFKELDQKLS